MHEDLIARCRFLSAGQDDPHSAALYEAADALEAMRADAERYRWLRDSPEGNQIAGLFRREWDAAIDAARGST